MSNEWDTLSKSEDHPAKSGTSARFIDTSFICYDQPYISRGSSSLRCALPSIGRLVILNVSDKREREREKGSHVELERKSDGGSGRGWEADEAVRVRDGRTGAVRRRYRRDDRCFRTNY